MGQKKQQKLPKTRWAEEYSENSMFLGIPICMYLA
jgi:hypothetical protein